MRKKSFNSNNARRAGARLARLIEDHIKRHPIEDNELAWRALRFEMKPTLDYLSEKLDELALKRLRERDGANK